MAVRWGHWSAGIQWLRVTRHQDHDSKHMPAHSDTGLATQPHSSTPGISANNNKDFIFCQMSRRSSYTAQQRRDENMSVLTWRLIRWRGAWRVGMEHSDTGRVIQPHQFTPGLPARTFYFHSVKTCLYCLCNYMSVSVQPAHLTHRPR